MGNQLGHFIDLIAPGNRQLCHRDAIKFVFLVLSSKR
jgi:hypothetical protein